MVRGTFANIRLRNQLAPGTEGGWTRHLPDGETDDDLRRLACGTRPRASRLIVLAGKEYGSGSSRDWAAKGPLLLGIRAVIAESYERIHRSNLVGMGILPLQFRPGETAESLGLTGEELYTIEGLPEAIASRFAAGRELTVTAEPRRRAAHPLLGVPSGSTPPRRSVTMNTAAFCPTCSASCSHGESMDVIGRPRLT